MRKLLLGEVNVVLEDGAVFALKARELTMTDKFADAGRTKAEKVFVVFAPGRPESKKYAQMFDQGIRELRQSRKLAGILKKYGVSDWK